jgi:hypothetical protein
MYLTVRDRELQMQTQHSEATSCSPSKHASFYGFNITLSTYIFHAQANKFFAYLMSHGRRAEVDSRQEHVVVPVAARLRSRLEREAFCRIRSIWQVD